MSEFDDWWEENYMNVSADRTEAEDIYNLGVESQQTKIDELQARVGISEKLRDLQFEKLWSLTQAIETARNGADEDFDLFLNYLSNILKGNKDD